MKFHAFLPALLVVGSLTLATAPARATLGLLGGLGSVCDSSSFGGDCDLFGNLIGGFGNACTTPLVGPPMVIGLGSVCDAPSFGDDCNLFGSWFGGGSGGKGGSNGGGLDDCNPGGGTGGGGTSPVPEPGSLALLALGATALGGAVLRRRK